MWPSSVGVALVVTVAAGDGRMGTEGHRKCEGRGRAVLLFPSPPRDLSLDAWQHDTSRLRSSREPPGHCSASALLPLGHCPFSLAGLPPSREGFPSAIFGLVAPPPCLSSPRGPLHAHGLSCRSCAGGPPCPGRHLSLTSPLDLTSKLPLPTGCFLLGVLSSS